MKKIKSGGVLSVILAFMMAITMLIPTSVMQAFAADSVKCELKATKVLDGGTLKADQFTFKIEAVTENAPMPANTTATNDADGNVSFGEATYTAAGTYEYKVTEVKGDDSSITYDTDAKTITVTVTEEASTTGDEAPNNGANYTPKQHKTSTADENNGYPVKVSYNHGSDIDAGYYSPKTVTYQDESGTEHVFCGANYKSASSSNFGERTAWKATDILTHGIVNYAGLSGLDAGSFGGVMNMLDCVAYLYSYDYFSYDNSNAASAWSNPSDPAVMKGDALRDAVQKVMYNLYPYNAAGYENTDDLRKTTQEALFFILKCGQGYINGTLSTADSEFRGYATDQDMFDAAVAFALKGENPSGKFQNCPDGTEVYVYWNVLIQESTGKMAITKESAVAQPLLGIYAPYDATTLNAVATTVEFNNKVSSTDDSTEGKLATTVTAGSQTGTADKAATLTAEEASTVTKVTDKIDYEGLVKGNTYKVEGTLYNVTDKKDVATASEDLKAEDTNGTWELTFSFDAGTLEAGKTYVVFEKATPIKDADGNEIKDGEAIEHKDEKDLAQTIVVEENEIVIKTQVMNQYISPAPKQTIVDRVDFTGLDSSKTYTLVGVVMNKATNKAVASDCEPEVIKNAMEGRSMMSFRNIDASDFKEDDELVVFEYLYEGDKPGEPGDGTEVAKHADITDVKQTSTVVDGEITLTKTTTETSAVKGDEIPYTITVKNERKVDAVVNIVDMLPDGLEFVKSSDNGIFYKGTGSEKDTVRWDVVTVPANSQITVDIVARITTDETGDITNYAAVSEEFNETNVLGFDDDGAVLGVYDAASGGGGSTTTTTTKGVNTGDANQIVVWVVLLAAAIAAVTGFIMKRRNSQR